MKKALLVAGPVVAFLMMAPLFVAVTMVTFSTAAAECRDQQQIRGRAQPPGRRRGRPPSTDADQVRPRRPGLPHDERRAGRQRDRHRPGRPRRARPAPTAIGPGARGRGRHRDPGVQAGQPRRRGPRLRWPVPAAALERVGQPRPGDQPPAGQPGVLRPGRPHQQPRPARHPRLGPDAADRRCAGRAALRVPRRLRAVGDRGPGDRRGAHRRRPRLTAEPPRRHQRRRRARGVRTAGR